jgi:hypothetical protein
LLIGRTFVRDLLLRTAVMAAARISLVLASSLLNQTKNVFRQTLAEVLNGAQRMPILDNSYPMADGTI